MRSGRIPAGVFACLWLSATAAGAQSFFNDFCSITPVNFQFERNQSLSTAQTFSGQGCTTSFRGDVTSSFEQISVTKRARHLTITPTSNGFGFTVARKTSGYTGPDSYTLRICGQSSGKRGCVTITYDVTIR
ncbi:MAG: hypothetical protein ACRCTI_12610 [Beijerinckiaceae bacterium]